MADGLELNIFKFTNRHISRRVQDIATKFGVTTPRRPLIETVT